MTSFDWCTRRITCVGSPVDSSPPPKSGYSAFRGRPPWRSVAGADPHEGDSLGRLSLTFDGLARRDAFVLDQCREVGLPVAITIGGGYGRDIEDTVRIHVTTARIAASHVARAR